MPATPRQRRYDQVMGECEPRVTDKKFVHELQLRLEAKYAESQVAKERQLAECEKKRVRKLVLEGVLESDEKRKAKNSEKSEEWREFWPPNPNMTLEQYEEQKRKAEEERQMQEQAAAEEERRRQEEEEREAREAEEEKRRQEQQQQEEEAARQANEDVKGKYVQAVPDCIRQLLVEEDLDRLYELANDLVQVTAATKTKAK